MKILYIITQADGGGAQKYTLALAKHFGGAIAAGNEASRLFTDAQRAGLTTFELKHLKREINPWHDILAVWEIRELIKSYNPDIVHLNSSKAGVLGSFAAAWIKASASLFGGRYKMIYPKIVFTAHGFIFNEPLPKPVKAFYLALEKIASGYRDFIIAVSDADRQSALDNKIIAADKIATVHNGLPAVDFLPKNQAKKELRLDENKLIIGNTSNFYLTKGLDVLIKSISLLNDAIKNRCQFVFMGDGPERKNLELGIRNYGLENNIKLLGKIDAASLYLKAFDAFVLPSRKEGLPFALLEAIQAGLPIIATKVGGIPETLDDAGILVEPENSEELAQAIWSVLANPPKQKELSQKALERAKLFTEEKMLEETEKIYKRALFSARSA